MRIDGVTPIGRLKKTVVVDRPGSPPLSFTIQALPFGFEDTVLARLPVPFPPKGFAMVKGAVIRDPKTGQALETREVEDVGYQRRRVRMNFLHTVAGLVEALKADERIHWDSKEPRDEEKTEEWERFYGAVYEEMKAFGITAREVKKIMSETSSLSGLRDSEIEEVQSKTFLPMDPPRNSSGAGRVEDGGSPSSLAGVE